MAFFSERRDFQGATFFRTSFKGATVRSSDVRGMTMRSVELDGLDIDSHDLAFGRLLVNGVDVVPLVEAELNRRFPGRELQKAETPEGLRDGWVAVQEAWAATVASTPRSLVDAHVDDEWSLAQTLRHLVLATDAWLRRAILGLEQPFHEIGLLFTGAAEMGFDVSMFRTGEAGFDEVLEVRAERQQLVTDFLADATPELLAEVRDDPWGGGGGDWHPTVGDCIRVILEEEWAHLRYVRRDLEILAGRERLLRELYEAHGRRDIDAALRVFTDDVRWPDVAAGQTLVGHDAVRRYWVEQFQRIDPSVTPTAITVDGDRAVVAVHQIVRGLDGAVLAEQDVTHTYTFRNGQIASMEVS